MNEEAQQKIDRKKGRVVSGIILTLLLGLGFGLLVGKLAKAGANPDEAKESLSLGVILLRCAAVVVGGFAVIAFHELGHTLAGVAKGYRFLFYAAGPLWVENSHGRLKVKYNRLLSIWGGMAVCAPRDGENLRGRMAFIVAAGPAFSLLMAAACLFVWGGIRSMGPDPESALALAGFIGGAWGLLSLGILAFTIFPATMPGGLLTDGGRLLQLLRGGPRAEADAALVALTGLAMGGVRPREWAADLVEKAEQFDDGALFESSARSLAYMRALDSGDLEKAAEKLDATLALFDRVPEIFQPGFAFHGALFEARHRGNPAKAREYLEIAKGGLFVESHFVAEAEAAIALAEGDTETAAAKAREGLASMDEARFGASEADRERLEEILAEARESAGA